MWAVGPDRARRWLPGSPSARTPGPNSSTWCAGSSPTRCCAPRTRCWTRWYGCWSSAARVLGSGTPYWRPYARRAGPDRARRARPEACWRLVRTSRQAWTSLARRARGRRSIAARAALRRRPPRLRRLRRWTLNRLAGLSITVARPTPRPPRAPSRILDAEPRSTAVVVRLRVQCRRGGVHEFEHFVDQLGVGR